MAFDPTDEVQKRIAQENQEYNPDGDDNFELFQNPDKIAKGFTGDEPAEGEEIGFIAKQIKEDDQNRANIPPEGADVKKDE